MDPLAAYILWEDEQVRQECLAWLVSQFAPTDQRIIAAMLAEEDNTPTCAAILGIAHLPPEEQSEQVERAKDRIRHRLRRLAPKWKGPR
jgi:hypothetical protein